MGLPMYGRSFAGVDATKNYGLHQSFSDPGPGTWENGILDYDDIKNNYLAKSGWNRYWDQASRVPYISNEEENTFISYDDVESVAEKARYINAMGLAGGMWWDLSSDREGELLSSVWAEFLKYETTCSQSRRKLIVEEVKSTNSDIIKTKKLRGNHF